MNPRSDADAVRALARAATSRETGLDIRPLPELPSIDTLWPAILRHRLVEPLAPHAAALGWPDDLVKRLEETHRATRHQTAVQIVTLARLAADLDDAGIPWMLVKGMPLAVLTTGDPAGRGPGDLDLFVDPASIEHAHGVLRHHGWDPQVPLLRPRSWSRRYVESTYHEYTYDGPGTRADLHWRLDMTVDALADFEESWSRSQLVEIGGCGVRTLGLADTFRHVSHHAAKDHWSSIRQLIDLHRLARLDALWSSGYVPRGLDATSLMVVADQLGLPVQVPVGVATAVAPRSSRDLRRSLDAQMMTVVDPVRTPGVQGLRYARYRLRASRSWADVWRAAAMTALPATSLVAAGDRHALVMVPQVGIQRVSHAVRWAVRRLRRALRSTG